MRLPVASAMWMANSATSVFPAPVGADTMTDCPASIARIASSWKSSRGNGYRARNCSSSSITRHSTTGGRLDPRWPRRSSRPLFSLLEARAGLYSAGRAMIVFHVAITAAEDYLTRREGYRRGHIERLQGLRAASILIGGGPAPDGKTADIFYRLQQPTQLKNAIEEDPYWTGGVWTRYEPRSFAQFVEPWEMVPVVLDGSRKVTIVEGPVTDHAMAQFALIEMRGAGRVGFGGFFEDGRTLALVKTADPAEALRWFGESGFWKPAELAARPLPHVLQSGV